MAFFAYIRCAILALLRGAGLGGWREDALEMGSAPQPTRYPSRRRM